MQTASKKVINGWAMYDWANSVYNLVITTTFFPIYFLSVTKGDDGTGMVTLFGRKFVNASLYDYTLAAAYLIIALLYPVLTSIADTRGNKKKFMRFFCYMGSLGCMSLFFFDSSNIWLGLLAFTLAAMGYVGSLVFYNAFLPEIAAPEDRDRISAKGFSYGYLGSVLMQMIGFGLVIFMKGKEGLASQITFLLVGIWWIGFAQITFRRVPETPKPFAVKGNALKDGFREVKKVYEEIKHLPVLKRFLRGFFFYSMGVQTVMLAATLFGSQLLHLADSKLIVTVVLIQLVAIAGAILMSRLSGKFGNISVLIGVVFFWILICVAAYFIANVAEPLAPQHDAIEVLKKQYTAAVSAGDTGLAAQLTTAISAAEAKLAPAHTSVEFGFYGLAIAVGLVMGGIQSLSRSTYSKLMPETNDTASYFSYYDLTEKIAIVIGMFSFGYIGEITGNMKNSVLSLIFFFAVGIIWLFTALRIRKTQPTGVAAS
ncbi:MFS transporter [Filimonas effusa]|uniref:MFS transporter n=1 Tax=Filimonas effusa TaxID=2508721 RepID=UPI001FE6B120|nr:MFS transporter [Filimonas effusa]